MDTLREAIRSESQANGLAIIITNDYSDHNCLTHLPGTNKDGQKLVETFKALKFATRWERNVNERDLTRLLYQAQNLKHSMVKGYRCIVIVFAGHGCDYNYLYMQDGNKVHISNQIIEPLMHKLAPELGNIPRLFFIDACRGEKKMTSILVPRGTANKSISRGGSEIEMLKVPVGGGFLVAYSTMPEYEAYEHGSGGVWLSVLAETLRHSHNSVDDILTEVNEVLIKRYQIREAVQQPEKLSRLNQKVFLHPDIEVKPNEPEKPQSVKRRIAATMDNPTQEFSYPSTSQGNLTQPSYKRMLKRYSHANGASHPVYTDTPYFQEKYNYTYYWSCVEIKLPNGQVLKDDSKECFYTLLLAQESAAKNACKQIEHLNLANKIHCPETSENSHSRNEVSLFINQATSNLEVMNQSTENTLASTGHFEEQIKDFFQKHQFKPQYEFIADHSSDHPKYLCVIKYSDKRVDSGGYYSSKREAKEETVSKVLHAEGILNAGRTAN